MDTSNVHDTGAVFMRINRMNKSPAVHMIAEGSPAVLR